MCSAPPIPDDHLLHFLTQFPEVIKLTAALQQAVKTSDPQLSRHYFNTHRVLDLTGRKVEKYSFFIQLVVQVLIFGIHFHSSVLIEDCSILIPLPVILSTHPSSLSLFLPFPSILMTSSCRFCLGWP